jgi:glycerate kinase
LGVSIPAIRQARLGVSSKAHRPPPKGWEQAVIGLTENRIQHYHELIGALENTQKQKVSGSAGGIGHEPAHDQ